MKEALGLILEISIPYKLGDLAQVRWLIRASDLTHVKEGR